MSGLSVGSLAAIACIWEATARKLGNVHRYADFPDLKYPDFLLSAIAIAEPMQRASKQPLGQTIFEAISATRRVVSTNTNLGIVLLLAPLATVPDASELRSGVAKVLRSTTRADASAVYSAIRLAQPGGLGQVPDQDVQQEPTCTLTEAMGLAADRDRIALQYATHFAEVFDLGVPALLEGWQQFGCLEAAIVHCQLAWLASGPDSLIARKYGAEEAEHIRQRVADIRHLGGWHTAAGRESLRKLDMWMRSPERRLNPGTSADLVTASLFAALRCGKIEPTFPFDPRFELWFVA